MAGLAPLSQLASDWGSLQLLLSTLGPKVARLYERKLMMVSR